MTATSLSSDEVPGYLSGQPALRELVDPATLTVSEVGDGNLNLVFVCADAAGRRLVLKQALPYVRLVGPGVADDRGAGHPGGGRAARARACCPPTSAGFSASTRSATCSPWRTCRTTRCSAPG